MERKITDGHNPGGIHGGRRSKYRRGAASGSTPYKQVLEVHAVLYSCNNLHEVLY